ncbi:MAG: metallophosphoesterase [Clostridiaceae bacterium]|nr:metallophosphoesterase [Clostridiaceae bacterium]
MVKKILTFIVFFVIGFTVYFSMNYYVYSSLIRGIDISPTVSLLLKTIFTIGFITFIISQFLKRRYHVYFISYVGYLWLGILSIAFFIFMIKDIAVVFFPYHRNNLTYIALLTLFVFTTIAMVRALKGPIIKEVPIPVTSLPEALDGFTIVQLSDVHLGMFTSKGWVEKVVDQVNKINPDIVVITGDLVDDKTERIKPFSSIIKGINARYGVFAVAGNHEFYAGMDTFYTFARESSINVLKDEKISIHDELEIIGVEDVMVKKYTNKIVDFEKILPEPSTDKFTVFLSHQPTNFEKAAKRGVNLQLSGHTHAGQIPPMNFIVSLYYKYSYGLYKYNKSYIYTTSGTGTWGPPMRLFSSSEIVKLQLKIKTI